MNRITAYFIAFIAGGILIYVIDGVHNFHGYVKCYSTQVGGSTVWSSVPKGYEAQCAQVAP